MRWFGRLLCQYHPRVRQERAARQARPEQRSQAHGGVQAHGQAGVEKHSAVDLVVACRRRRGTSRSGARAGAQHRFPAIYRGLSRSQCTLQSCRPRQTVQPEGPRQVVAAAHGHPGQGVAAGPQGQQPAVDRAIAAKGQHAAGRRLVLDEVQRFGHRLGPDPLGQRRPFKTPSALAGGVVQAVTGSKASQAARASLAYMRAGPPPM